MDPFIQTVFKADTQFVQTFAKVSRFLNLNDSSQMYSA